MSNLNEVIKKSIIRQSREGHSCTFIYDNLRIAFSGENLTLQVP